MKQSNVQKISGLDVSVIIKQAGDKLQIEALLFKDQDSDLISGSEISVQAFSKDKGLIIIDPSFKDDETLVESHMAGGAAAHAVFFCKFDPELEIDRIEVNLRGDQGKFHFD
jgi:hypothetical protein